MKVPYAVRLSLLLSFWPVLSAIPNLLADNSVSSVIRTAPSDSILRRHTPKASKPDVDSAESTGPKMTGGLAR